MRVIATIGAAILGLAFLAVVTFGGDLLGLWYKAETAGFRGSSNAEQQIESAPSRIQRYQEFFNICQSVQAKEDAIDNLRAASSDRETAILANQNARATLIADYNSMSAQDYTAARFKASNLIYQIPRGSYTGDNKTECVQ